MSMTQEAQPWQAPEHDKPVEQVELLAHLHVEIAPEETRFCRVRREQVQHTELAGDPEPIHGQFGQFQIIGARLALRRGGQPEEFKALQRIVGIADEGKSIEGK